MIRRILLDIDDVLNRLTLTCLRHVGCDIGTKDYHKFPVKFGYDILGVANHLMGHTAEDGNEWDVPTFWNMIPRSLWATCPISAQAEWLLAMCEASVGRENVCLLTGPTKDPDCVAGKLEWIHDFMPSWLHRQYLIGPRKQFCAMSEALLIDDSDDNVKAFQAWGGHTILVPRPWNTLHATDIDKHLREQFQHFFFNFNGDCHAVAPNAVCASDAAYIGRIG